MNKPVISIEDVSKAIEYLQGTDEQAAKAKAYKDALDDQKKTILAIEYQNASGTQGDRNKAAEASANYRNHLDKLRDAVYDLELLKNRRRTQELKIEVWRSLNANQRRGNI